jgi:hypothetical protein
MGKGVDAARADSPLHAKVLDDFKDQLLIVFLKRLLKGSGKTQLRIPVAETDDTGMDLMLFAVRDGDFIFELRRKA